MNKKEVHRALRHTFFFHSPPMEIKKTTGIVCILQKDYVAL